MAKSPLWALCQAGEDKAKIKVSYKTEDQKNWDFSLIQLDKHFTTNYKNYYFEDLLLGESVKFWKNLNANMTSEEHKKKMNNLQIEAANRSNQG